ncbi:MAG: phosphonate C-P lyase system protein PhnH [Cyanobacteria bacterium P01_G01_bin.38]
MLVTSLPGFQDSVHDAQQTFRQLLQALARPGLIGTASAQINPPASLTPSCAAACLTLFDLETAVWLQPELDQTVTSWLRFHTGCPIVATSEQANFALVKDFSTMPELETFQTGSATDPEASATMLIQVEGLTEGIPVEIRGPGIQEKIEIAPQLPSTFWQQWQHNHQQYPLGVDVLLFADDAVMGLPRTSQAEVRG